MELFRWWSAETIAVVTGANRGIGFEITHQLASQGITVILTSREVAVGEESAKVLQEGGLDVGFHQLDIVDDESINSFCGWVKEKYGGIDILVNFVPRIIFACADVCICLCISYNLCLLMHTCAD